MSFKKYLDEMAIETGVHSRGAFSKKSDWNYYKNHLNELILVRDKLPGKMKIYKNNSNYFLIQKNEYKGHIQFREVSKNIIKIETSNSELNKGFYDIIFSVVLSDGVEEILSDIQLSTSAIKSYEKLNRNNSNFVVKIKELDKYLNFSKNNLLKNSSRVVSIRSKHNINELFKEYYYKINEKNGEKLGEKFSPNPYLRMYLEDDESLFSIIYSGWYELT